MILKTQQGSCRFAARLSKTSSNDIKGRTCTDTHSSDSHSICKQIQAQVASWLCFSLVNHKSKINAQLSAQCHCLLESCQRLGAFHAHLLSRGSVSNRGASYLASSDGIIRNHCRVIARTRQV